MKSRYRLRIRSYGINSKIIRSLKYYEKLLLVCLAVFLVLKNNYQNYQYHWFPPQQLEYPKKEKSLPLGHIRIWPPRTHKTQVDFPKQSYTYTQRFNWDAQDRDWRSDIRGSKIRTYLASYDPTVFCRCLHCNTRDEVKLSSDCLLVVRSIQ